ncbi:MAG: NAD(P)/FAD-dependent oxidoreductase [Bacteroidia bacterium]
MIKEIQRLDSVIPGTNLPRVIIIGGGFGGIHLAQNLANQAVQVVMFDKNNYHTFQPLLYQVATGGLEPDSIAFPLRKLFDDQENFIFRHAEVLQIDIENKTLETSIGAVSFDYLVLATGSITNFFGLDIQDKAMSMKTIPEALDLRSLILQNFEKANYALNPHEKSALLKFVVVGGGPTGVETAGALAELKKFVLPNDYPELDMRQMEIHLIEASDKLLNGMSEQASVAALKDLQRMGVHVWLNTVVKDYNGTKVITNKPLDFEASTVIWGAGVKGNIVAGIPSEQLNKAQRVKTDAFNRMENHENIFAIGDIAYMTAEAAYPNGHPQVAQVAMQQGANLAKNIANLLSGAPLKPFIYKDLGSMATIGRNKAVADLQKMHFKGYIAWLMWMMIHLIALIGFRNRLVVLANWVWSYWTYDRGARVIIRPYDKKEKELEVLEKG